MWAPDGRSLAFSIRVAGKGDVRPSEAATVQIHYTEYSLAKGQSSLNSINILFDLVIGRFLK